MGTAIAHGYSAKKKKDKTCSAATSSADRDRDEGEDEILSGKNNQSHLHPHCKATVNDPAVHGWNELAAVHVNFAPQPALLHFSPADAVHMRGIGMPPAPMQKSLSKLGIVKVAHANLTHHLIKQDAACGSALSAAKMMRASARYGHTLKASCRRAKHRLLYRDKMREVVRRHQARLLHATHPHFLFRPPVRTEEVVSSWSTVSGLNGQAQLAHNEKMKMAALQLQSPRPGGVHSA